MTTEHQRRAHELLRALQDAADMRRQRDDLVVENQKLRTESIDALGASADALRIALDSAKAEIKRLRQALEAMRELASVSTDGDGWYAEQAGLDADAIFKQAREALAGDGE